MIKPKFQELVNRNIRNLLDPMRIIHQNVVCINAHNSIEHETLKFKIGYALSKQGLTWVSEAYLKSGQIADIICVDLENPIIFEVAISETKESIDYKNKTYPCRIVWVRSEKDLENI